MFGDRQAPRETLVQLDQWEELELLDYWELLDSPVFKDSLDYLDRLVALELAE